MASIVRRGLTLRALSPPFFQSIKMSTISTSNERAQPTGYDPSQEEIGKDNPSRLVTCFFCKEREYHSKYWAPSGHRVERQHCSLLCWRRYALCYRASPLIRLEHALACVRKKLATATHPPYIADLERRQAELMAGIEIARAKQETVEQSARTKAKKISEAQWEAKKLKERAARLQELFNDLLRPCTNDPEAA